MSEQEFENVAKHYHVLDAKRALEDHVRELRAAVVEMVNLFDSWNHSTPTGSAGAYVPLTDTISHADKLRKLGSGLRLC